MSHDRQSSVFFESADALTEISYVVHGFFGKWGGVSAGPFSSLNCALSSAVQTADSVENVIENRKRALACLNIPFGSLVTLHQVHGNDVQIIKCVPDQPLAADAMVTASPGVALGILTADCAPVFFADREKKIIGACHAGWKGALAGVVENTVKAMMDLGSHKTSIQAVIGPTICPFSYEVDEKFCQFFLTKDRSSAIFFQPSPKKQHYQFDLPGFLIKRMQDFGLKNPLFIEKDTKTGPFFSRRQALEAHWTQYGCGISVIMIA